MKTILFLCTGNSCRSQMAEGFAKHFYSDKFQFFSAGTHKHGMNKRAIQVMNEAQIDLSSHYSKTLDELSIKSFDYVITVCSDAEENCPFGVGKKQIHIGFADPPRLTKDLHNEEEILNIYRKVRDEIEVKIKNLEKIL